MSVIDTQAHTVVAYEAGKTKALDGQRLSVLFWKTGKDGVKKDSKCASIPVLTKELLTPVVVEAMTPHILEMIAKVQNNIIRDRVEAGATSITNEEIDMDSVVSYMNSSDATGNRLTKESVSQWFDSVLADSLMLALAEKLGISTDAPTPEQMQKVEKATAMYKEKIAALAGGKTSYSAPLAASLKNALLLAGEEDSIASKFVVRLDKMIAAPEVDLSALL